MKKDILVLASILGIIFPATGYAFSVSAVGGYILPSAAVVSTGVTTQTHSPSYLAGGLLLGFNLAPTASIELGMLYGPRGFQESSNGGSLTEITFNTIQFPLLLRIYLVPAVSIGFGGYFSHGIGSVSSYPADDPSSVTSIAYGLHTFGADDSGAVVSFALKIKLISVISLVCDARYLYGLNNVSHEDGVTTYLRDLQLLGGIRIGR